MHFHFEANDSVLQAQSLRSKNFLHGDAAFQRNGQLVDACTNCIVLQGHNGVGSLCVSSGSPNVTAFPRPQGMEGPKFIKSVTLHSGPQDPF